MKSSRKSKMRIVANTAYSICFLMIVLLVVNVAYYAYTYGATGPGIKLFSMDLILISMAISGSLPLVLRLRYPYDFFNHSNYELSGAYRYDFVYDSREGHVEFFRKSILKDGFEFVGSIENQFDATMEVYLRSLELKRDIALLIETEVFTEDLLLEHWALFKKFIVEYSGYPNWDWKKRMRTVVSVSEMSFPLQILLTTNKILGEPIEAIREVFGQVYALVAEERKVYVKVYPEKGKVERVNWLEEYFSHPKDKEAEHVWGDVKWKDIEHEFPHYKDMVMVVHKAMNVWKDGYQEDQGKMDADESPQKND